MINFALIGAGWRAEFYIRIANALPNSFNINGIYIRNPQKSEAFKAKHNIKVFDDLDALLDTNPNFVVSCVAYNSICDEIELLCNKGVAVLSETPAGANLEQIDRFAQTIKPDWRVQVAEQFHLQPQCMAITEIINSGILGETQHVQLFFCHDYHAVSLIRRFLGIGNQLPKTKSITIPDRVISYDGRDGLKAPTEIEAEHILAYLNYGDKNAIYDFSNEQYFSDLRCRRMVIRGTTGEITDNICTYIDGDIPVSFTLNRVMRGSNGNLDGLYLESINGNGKVLYRNPFGTARLTDEELAIAHCLVKMDNFVKSGENFYPLEEAMIDAKTALLWKKNKIEA